MKQLFLKGCLILIVAWAACTLVAQTCTTIVSASPINWNASSSWDCGGVGVRIPTNADACTISATTARILVTDAQTCGQIAQNGVGTTISESIEILPGGTLTVDGTAGRTGNIVPGRATALLVHGGHLVFKPPIDTAVVMAYSNTQGTAPILPQLDLCADAACTDKLPAAQWVKAIDVIKSGSSTVRITFGGGIGPTVNAHNVILDNLGGSNNSAGLIFCSNAGSSGNVTFHNVIYMHSGGGEPVQCAANVNPVISIDNFIVWESGATAGNRRALTITTGNRPAAGSEFSNIFLINPPGWGLSTGWIFNNNGSSGYDFQLGSYAGMGNDVVDKIGFFGYNTNLSWVSGANYYNKTARNFGFIIDAWGAGNDATLRMSTAYTDDSGMKWDHGFSYGNVMHQHHFNNAANNNVPVGPPNSYDHVWIENAGISGTTGHWIAQSEDTATITNSLFTGYGSDLYEGGGGVARCKHTYVNNTEYGELGGHLYGHFGCSANCVNAIHNHIFAHPNQTPGGTMVWGGMRGSDTFVRQNMNDGVDYNLFWQMGNSGDPGSENGIVGMKTMSNEAIGTNFSYITVNTGQTLIANKPITQNDCPQGCAHQVIHAAPGTYADARRGDQFANPSPGRVWDVIESATPDTITLMHGCGPNVADSPAKCGTAVTVGSTSWTIYPGWGARPEYAIYGVDPDFGTHDIHADPQWSDPTRTPCSYVVSKGYRGVGSGAATTGTFVRGCPGTDLPAPNAFLTMTGGTYPTLQCSGCRFQTWGIDSNDSIGISRSSVVTCSAAVESVQSETQLTLARSASCDTYTPQSNDRFWFITPTLNLAKYIMAASGWTFTGNPSTGYTLVPVTPNGWSFRDMWAYAAGGFTPHNPALAHAGQGGTYVGAFPMEDGGITPPSEGWHVGHIGPTPPSP